MSTLFEQVEKLIKNKSVDAAVNAILKSNASVRQFVIKVGVEHLQSKQRAQKRRILHRETINPTFATSTTPSSVKPVNLSTKTRNILMKEAENLFIEYKIGGYNLGDFTKEMLIAEAEKEQRSGQGHFLNAAFLSRLAEPMVAGQKVPDYWESPEAVKLIRRELWDKQEPDQKKSKVKQHSSSASTAA